MNTELWNPKKIATMKIRAKISILIRLWFNRHNYFEVHGPILIPSTDNSIDLFRVKYSENEYCLTYGLGSYASALTGNLGKIFSILPVFRPEKKVSDRHLLEFWMIEAEILNGSLNKLLRAQENLIRFICRHLAKEAKQELKELQRTPEDLVRFDSPFPKLTYDNAIDLLQKEGIKINWGTNIDWENEKKISAIFDRPFFVTKFPLGQETSFFQNFKHEPLLTKTADLIAPEGYGELSTGGQPITQREELLDRMKDACMNHETQDLYCAFRGRSASYSGFAMGLERFVQWICRLQNIEEAIAFPRQRYDFYP